MERSRARKMVVSAEAVQDVRWRLVAPAATPVPSRRDDRRRRRVLRIARADDVFPCGFPCGFRCGFPCRISLRRPTRRSVRGERPTGRTTDRTPGSRKCRCSRKCRSPMASTGASTERAETPWTWTAANGRAEAGPSRLPSRSSPAPRAAARGKNRIVCHIVCGKRSCRRGGGGAARAGQQMNGLTALLVRPVAESVRGPYVATAISDQTSLCSLPLAVTAPAGWPKEAASSFCSQVRKTLTSARSLNSLEARSQ